MITKLRPGDLINEISIMFYLCKTGQRYESP